MKREMETGLAPVTFEMRKPDGIAKKIPRPGACVCVCVCVCVCACESDTWTKCNDE